MKITRFFALLAVASLSMTTLFAQETAPVLNMKSVPTDTSGNNNNGTTWRTGGMVEDGKFVNDGGEKGTIFCPNSASLNIGTGDLTIVLTTTLQEKQNSRIGLIGKGVLGSKNPGYSLLYNSSKKQLYLQIGDGTIRTGLKSNEVVLNDNKLHRIAASLNREAGTAVFAVDGKTFTARGNTLKGKSLDSKVKLSIGSWGYGYFINGAIGDIQLYKKAFSEDELAKLTSVKEEKKAEQAKE